MPFDPDKPYNDLPLLPPRVEMDQSRAQKGNCGEQSAGGVEGGGRVTGRGRRGPTVNDSAALGPARPGRNPGTGCARQSLSHPVSEFGNSLSPKVQ